jgi:hypothetical protein
MRRASLFAVLLMMLTFSASDATAQLDANFTSPNEMLYNGRLSLFMSCRANAGYVQEVFPYVTVWNCDLTSPSNVAYGITPGGNDIGYYPSDPLSPTPYAVFPQVETGYWSYSATYAVWLNPDDDGSGEYWDELGVTDYPPCAAPCTVEPGESGFDTYYYRWGYAYASGSA